MDKVNEVKFSIWEDLCKFVMNKCIILPIECNNQETALTIFQTLNNRGLDLHDADIFKAQIYRSKGTPEAQKIFTDQWNGLVEICEAAKLEVDDIFRYYTHVLRGKEENIHNEIALRKFYSKGRLEDDSLMGDVIHLAKFWACLNSGGGYDDDIDSKINAETRQWVHCLSKYPNDYWKYVTSVYFHCRHVDENFAEGLAAFLKDTVRFLFLKFIEQVGRNRIKPGIYNGCVNIYKNKSPVFNSIKIEDFEKRLEHPPKALVSSLLLLHAYLNPDQKERPIRSDSLQIEHIFPKQWQDTNYNGWNRADADQYLEKFGNKVICHRKVNIQAGNNYFGRKKEKYEGNAIANVAKLANYESDDWTKVDIDKRQEKVTKELREFFGYLLA